jgi:hypothetical protein
LSSEHQKLQENYRKICENSQRLEANQQNTLISHKKLEEINAELLENLRKNDIKAQKAEENLQKAEEKLEVLGNQNKSLEEEKRRLIGVSGKFQANLKEILGKFYAELKEEKKPEFAKPSEILLELERIAGNLGEFRYL